MAFIDENGMIWVEATDTEIIAAAIALVDSLPQDEAA